MNDGLGPNGPIRFGPEAVLIPRSAFEQSVAVGKGRQQELALPGNEIAAEMTRLDVRVGTPLIQRRGILRDGETKQMGFVLDFYGFDARSTNRSVRDR
jgi:hypothetical protein